MARHWESMPGCERRREYRDVFDPNDRRHSDEDFETDVEPAEFCTHPSTCTCWDDSGTCAFCQCKACGLPEDEGEDG